MKIGLFFYFLLSFTFVTGQSAGSESFNFGFHLFDLGHVFSSSELTAFRPSVASLTAEEWSVAFLSNSSNTTNLVIFIQIYGNVSTNSSTFSLPTMSLFCPQKSCDIMKFLVSSLFSFKTAAPILASHSIY